MKYCVKYCYFAIRCAKIILSCCEVTYQQNCRLKYFQSPVLCAYSCTRTRVRILFGYNVCASRIHTIDRGWMREKEREGKEKKEGKEGRGNGGEEGREKRDGERQEIQGTRPSKEFFSFPYFSCREYDTL